MPDYNLTDFNDRFGRAAPPAPRWHEDCGRACPCWNRARREEREVQQEAARRAEIDRRLERLGEEDEVGIFRVTLTVAAVVGLALLIVREFFAWR